MVIGEVPSETRVITAACCEAVELSTNIVKTLPAVALATAGSVKAPVSETEVASCCKTPFLATLTVKLTPVKGVVPSSE
jgi:hypothetical protein